MKRAGYGQKRDAILDVAGELITTRGYERVSVDEMISSAGISKGTFYHYFKTKMEVLEGILGQFTAAYLDRLAQVMEQPGLSALEKLNAFFRLSQAMKKKGRGLINRSFTIYARDPIFRDRLDCLLAEALLPHLESILNQGAEEGAFQITAPRETARLLIGLTNNLRLRMIELLLEGQEPVGEDLKRIVEAFQQAMERILAAPKGSVTLFSGDFAKTPNS